MAALGVRIFSHFLSFWPGAQTRDVFDSGETSTSELFLVVPCVDFYNNRWPAPALSFSALESVAVGRKKESWLTLLPKKPTRGPFDEARPITRL